MGNWPAFFEANWFNLVQSVGIIAGLIFTAVTIHRDSKAHRMTALLALEEQHRELWSELHRRPELARILAREVDLVGSPITSAEAEFLNTVFVHFCTGWRLAAEHGVFSEADLINDIANFLSLPIPLQVWRQTEGIREKRFVDFVKRAPRKSNPRGG